MSGNIDRRIVEMRFDNKDFEKNVGQTLISLDTLQKALQMSEGQQGLEKTKKGLFNLGKACQQVDASSLSNNVEQISNRFSTLGIIGTSVLQTIGQHIAEVGFKVKNLLLAPLAEIKRGGLTRALNLEQANFQIEGLGIGKNDTASYYTEVMDAVLGTAYSYDVAAKAASQLAASDVGVIEKEKVLLNGTKTTAKYFSGEMTDAILGIAGVAAMTGSSFEDISQVFTRVAGQGRLMSNDLNSISARGLNAAATLAKYLDKTEAEVRDMVTKGQIDFDTFSKAMTEAFGSHAKDATQTFTGALEDTKAALARIGADFYAPILTGARDVLNSITPLVDVIKTKIQPALNLSGRLVSKYSKQATVLLDTLTITGSNLTNKFGHLSPQLTLVKNGVEAVEEATKDLESGSAPIFDSLAKRYGVTSEKAKEMAKSGEISFSAWLTAVRKFSSSGEKEMSALQSYFGDLSAEMRRYENVADSLGITQGILRTQFSEFAKMMNTDVDTIYEAVGEKLGKTGEQVKDSLEKGTLSVTDFRRALTELRKEEAISEEQFAALMDPIDKFIIKNGSVAKVINDLKSSFGSQFQDIFKAGKDVLNLFKDAFKGLINILSGNNGHSALLKLVEVVLSLTAAVGRCISKLIELGRSTGVFKRLYEIISSVNEAIYSALDSLLNWGKTLEIDFTSISESLGKLLAPIQQLFSILTEFVSGKISQGLSLLTQGFEKLLGGLSNALSYLAKATTIFKAIGAAIMTVFGVKLMGQMSMFNAIINETANQFRKLGGLGLADLLKKLTASGTGVSTISAVNDTLWKLRDTLLGFQTVIKARTLAIIATAVLELAAAVKILSSISPDKLAMSVVGIQALMQELVLASHQITPANTKGLITLSFTVKILASAIKTLSDLSVGGIAKGITAIGILMQMLAKMSIYMSVISPGEMSKVAGTLILYAFALRMMIKPIKQIGEMKLQDIAKGVVAVAVTLQILSRAAKSFSEFKPGELLKAAAAMILFGIAINELVIPIELLGHMNIKSLGKGLGSIAAILIMLGLFTAAMTKISYMGPEMMMLAPALLAMAKALVIISAALALMSNTANIGTGLSVMFSSLLILAAAMYAMQRAIPGAAAMILVAAALAIIAPPLVMLSSLNFGGVVVGLIALAGAIAIFGASALVLTAAWAAFLPGIALLLALSAAVALLGVGVLALGSGMIMLAAAFKTGTESIVEGLTALAAMLPTVTGYLWDFIKGMLTGFIEAAPLIVQAITVLIDSLLEAVWTNVPKMAKVGLALIVALMQAISDKIGEITNLAIDIVTNFINALASRAGDMAIAGANLMISFFNATADAIATQGPALIASVENIMLSVLEVIVGQIPFFGQFAADAIEKYRQGLVEGQPGVEGAANANAKASEIKPKDQSGNGKKAANTFKQGLGSGKGQIKTTATANANAANMKVPDQSGNGRAAVSGLISGLGSMVGKLQAKASQIANIVDRIIRLKNRIHSPSKRLAETGKYMMQGLIAGLDSLTPEYQNRAENIATMMIDSTNKAADAMSAFVSPMNLSGAIAQSTDVNLRMNDIRRENEKLASGINKLNTTLSSMTETMNSRALNNYITIDGSGDPEAFADGLIRSFRLNARTV